MALFDVPEIRTTREDDLEIAKRTKKQSKSATTSKRGGGLLDRIERIRQTVEKNLGQYRDEYMVITDKEVLHDFISACISNKYIAIDTETTGLNPLVDIIAGICPYTYGQKSAYIPINHISYITGEKAKGQLDADFIISEFDRLFQHKIEVDMFNATFDIRVLRHFGLKNAYCTWDGSIGARILNENEPVNNLKDLHNKYCLDGKGDAFRFDDLFKGIEFTKIPYNVGFLYAAHDPIITSELCNFQREHLRPDSEREDIRAMYWVFKNIEMPIVKVVCDLEDTGVKFDFNKNEELKIKYHALLDEKEQLFRDAYSKYSDDILRYNIKHPGVLDDPINIKSVPQLQALLFDIIGLVGPIDKKTKQPSRSTDKENLASKELKDDDVVKTISAYREFATLVSTFVDKLPECVQDDGRIHCKFNQYGADTGRFSSSDPNLQNIPSHNKDIRQMFVASDDYVLLSSDYSQQEPSCLAAFCKEAGSDALFNARFKGNDLYSEVASACFNVPYDECCEFDKNHHKNPPEYKARRNQAKPILLGILYGRGDASVAEQLNCTMQEAQQLKLNLFRRFPEINQFEKDSLQMAKDIGYVTTVCGRKRRLPDLQLDEFEFRWKDNKCPYDDPLDFTMSGDLPVPYDRQVYYLNELSKVRFKAKQKVFSEADKEGIKIVDNGKKIADATRQCVNSRIQGSAADLTKLAMIKLDANERLKELNFRMLIPVHDEIIAECPEENAKECADLLAKVMSDAAQEILHMPFSCDVECSRVWYGESIEL